MKPEDVKTNLERALDYLADRIENGHLIIATDGADLFYAAADEIDTLRAEIEWLRAKRGE